MTHKNDAAPYPKTIYADRGNVRKQSSLFNYHVPAPLNEVGNISPFEQLGINLDLVDSNLRNLAAVLNAPSFTPAHLQHFRELVRRARFATLQSSITYQKERQLRRHRYDYHKDNVRAPSTLGGD